MRKHHPEMPVPQVITAKSLEHILSFPEYMQQWLQVNITFFSTANPSSERIPWSEIADILGNMRAAELFRWTFFTRKPPGLRVRFSSDKMITGLLPRLVEWLNHAESADWIRGYRFDKYEPEVHRFGGRAGMEIAHLAFDADTKAVIRYMQEPQLRSILSSTQFSIVSFENLCSRVTENAAEVWDVFKSLEYIVRGVDNSAIDKVEITRMKRKIERTKELVSSNVAIKQLVESVWSENEHIASCLQAARTAGELSIGLREWLVAAAVFHWNRLGLTTRELAPLLASRIAVLEGK